MRNSGESLRTVIKAVLKDIDDASEGQSILFIDELHTVVGRRSGRGGGRRVQSSETCSGSRANFVVLAQRLLDEYRKYIENRCRAGKKVSAGIYW